MKNIKSIKKLNINTKLKEFYEDQCGSIMIESAIYFPMIIIMVLIIVMLSLFKLDKIMTQSNLSIKANRQQIEIDQEEIYTYSKIQAMGNNTDLDNMRLLKVNSSSSRVYQWVDQETIYPIVEVDYTSDYSLNFFGLIPQTTSHTFLVKHNPVNTRMSIHDVSMFRNGATGGGGKIGYSYDDYLKQQYGY